MEEDESGEPLEVMCDDVCQKIFIPEEDLELSVQNSLAKTLLRVDFARIRISVPLCFLPKSIVQVHAGGDQPHLQEVVYKERLKLWLNVRQLHIPLKTVKLLLISKKDANPLSPTSGWTEVKVLRHLCNDRRVKIGPLLGVRTKPHKTGLRRWLLLQL